MKITSDFFALTFGKAINTPLLLLETTLIARILGPDGFGQWSLLLAAATLLHNVLLSWTYPLTIKFGCEEWMQRKSLSQILTIRSLIILMGLFLSLFLVIGEPMNWLTSAYSLEPKLGWIVFFYIISLWLTFEAQSNLQALQEFTLQALITPFITFTSILFLSVSFLKMNVDFIFIASGVLLVRCLFWAVTWIFSIKKGGFYWQWPSVANIKKAMHFGWPLLPTLLLGYFSDWGDHILLGLFCSVKEVGLWGAANQVMLWIISMNSILVSLLLPWVISRSKLTTEVDKFYLRSVLPTIMCLWLTIIFVIVAFFPVLFSIFMGSQFQNAYPILLILNLCILTNVFSSLYGILFT